MVARAARPPLVTSSRARMLELDDHLGDLDAQPRTADDPLAVVNPAGKVHGVEGLRVVDASVMPTSVRANTNLTAIMIGEKIADMMKEGR